MLHVLYFIWLLRCQCSFLLSFLLLFHRHAFSSLYKLFCICSFVWHTHNFILFIAMVRKRYSGSLELQRFPCSLSGYFTRIVWNFQMLRFQFIHHSARQAARFLNHHRVKFFIRIPSFRFFLSAVPSNICNHLCFLLLIHYFIIISAHQYTRFSHYPLPRNILSCRLVEKPPCHAVTEAVLRSHDYGSSRKTQG